MNILIPEELAIKKPDSKLLKILNNKTFKDKVLYELNSDFHNIKVVENEVGRFLHYKDTYQAGFINTEFYRGNLPYINYFLISYLFKPKAKKILLIGMGSGKLVNDLEFLFDDLKTLDVVDLEENIVNIAENWFDFKPSKSFNFILQDGITYLRNCRKKYDIIIVDVANNDGIDMRFLSEEYFSVVKKCLKKSGIFVSNMCASPDFKNPQNLFFTKYFPVYKKFFNNNLVYKGNYSDKVYYKSFYNLDERVIDITNVIIFSSNSNLQKTVALKEKINKLNIDTDKYLKDEN